VTHTGIVVTGSLALAVSVVVVFGHFKMET
jgi:hypothetical protein